MPTFYNNKWNDYSLKVTNSSPIRQILKFYTFCLNTELIPYFYSTEINYDLLLVRHRKRKNANIQYEWQLIKMPEMQVVDEYKGAGDINVSKLTTRNWKTKGIHLGRISRMGQYKVQAKISNGIESSGFMDIAEFVIKDKDEFGMYILWIIISVVIGAIVGAIVGSQI